MVDGGLVNYALSPWMFAFVKAQLYLTSKTQLEQNN